MGCLTSLHAIDGGKFDELRKRRLLPRLIKVLAEAARPETIGLPVGHVFASTSLDKAWDEIDALFERTDPIDGRHFARHHRYYCRTIGRTAGGFWDADGVLYTLGTFSRLCRCVAAELATQPVWTTHDLRCARDVSGSAEVVAKASLDATFALLLRSFVAV